MTAFGNVLATKDPANPRIARITLNRPDKLNAIDSQLPGQIRAAVEWAEADPEVHVIVLQGAGRAFCAGYDMAEFAEAGQEHPCKQEDEPWDPMVDYATMKRYTRRALATCPRGCGAAPPRRCGLTAWAPCGPSG